MNTKRNDFDEIYDKYADCGFLFYFDGDEVGESNILTRDDMKRISVGKGNGDKLFVVCEPCDTFMDFEAGRNVLEGRWVCPCCGAQMEERLAYEQLDNENEEFLKQMENDDFDEFYD